MNAPVVSVLNPADLTVCDREPITRLGRIQSFAFLIALGQDKRVSHASDNLRAFLGIEPEDAIGRPLDGLIDSDSLHEIRNRLQNAMTSGAVERLYGLSLVTGRPAFDLAVHYVGKICVIEGEVAGLNNRLDAASHVRRMVAKLATQPNLTTFAAEISRQIRALTGFDRVMVYRFRPDGAGEVVAETIRMGMEPFLGLHYPASDIPVQARALYLKNVFRIIADVDAPTAPLLTGGEHAPDPLDLSLAISRAVSPVHLEYLRNLHVRASLSISIIIEGQLWGLIACHHETPNLPTSVIRSAAELFGLMVSMTLESRLRLDALEYQRLSTHTISRLMNSVAGDPALISNAGWLHGVIKDIIACDALATVKDGKVVATDSAPASAAIVAVVKFLDALPPREVFATDSFASLHSEAALPAAELAGVLSIPIGRAGGDYVLLFRREQLSEIKWAGESDGKTRLAADDPQRLSPRKSFAAFVERVRGHSIPFSLEEQRTAESLRLGLIERMLRGSIDETAEQIKDGNRQELLIAELNHRVRNVLALIRGLITQTQGAEGDSASYVKSLSGRVQALARAHDRINRHNWGPGPVNAIFEDEIAAYVPTQRHRFTLSGPFVFLLPQAYSTLALVVHELVTNSTKYGALCDGGNVQVTLSVAAGEGLHFRWLESGGPQVTPPTRRGFGSVIIERVVPFDLQGTAEVQYLATGVDARFVIPERFMSSGVDFDDPPSGDVEPAPVPVKSAEQARFPLSGLEVILLEDNLIVALEGEEMLRALGAKMVYTVSTVAGARDVLAAHPIQFAVLDIHLGGETSLRLAADLKRTPIPYVFASGYGEVRTPTAIPNAEVVIAKPYDRETLCAGIEAVLQ